MKLSDEQMRALWQSADNSGLQSTPCLAEEFILRAGQNKLSVNEQTTFQTHLTNCPGCVEAYLIAKTTYAWAVETATLTQKKHRFSRSFNDGGVKRWLAVSAALLFATSIGLGIWLIVLSRERQAWQGFALRQQNELARLPDLQAQITTLQNEHSQALQLLKDENKRLQLDLAQLTQPQLEMPIIDADPANLARGATHTSVTRVEVPATAAFFTLILHLGQESSAKKLLLEWQDTHGKLLWQREFTNASQPNVTLMMSRQKVPAGRYQVRLFALRNQLRQPLEHYEVNVVYHKTR